MSDAAMEQVRQDNPQRSAGWATRAERVTLFEDRAEVVRRAVLQGTAGVRVEAFAGVSLVVDDGTVQAKVLRGTARVLSVRVVRRMHLEKALGREEIEALEAASRDARERMAAADQAIERTQRSLQHHFQMSDQWIKSVALGPKNGSEPKVIEAYRDAWKAIDVSAHRSLGEIEKIRADRLQAEQDWRLADKRLREGLRESPRHDAVIEVELDAREAGEIEIELGYRLPCALWRPEHNARLLTEKSDSKTGKIEITTYAVAWQNTGETWENVEVRFSTARPAKEASAPLLSDDVLSSRKKTEEERRNVVIAAREQTIDMAGLDRGAREVADMPGVDDGGEPLNYVGKERVTLPSNGRPFRVEIGRTNMDAEVARVLMATRSPAAHIRATATLSGSGPLLAGPVRLARGSSIVGRAKIDFIGKGEPFELGFGPDDGIRVRRMEDEERDTQTLTGAQRIRRKVSLFLSNISGTNRSVLVNERVPVSEIDEVEIQMLDAGPFKLDAKDGFLRTTVDVGARATKIMRFSYEVRAGSKVVLPEF
ncbi:MAG TPA: DUF4139 domain-containing protein [Polyangium sp.]|nr:DUF4139 domain-containing protein [Polyangium sp.]